MSKREEHCAFARLNPAGRCIAYCHYNQGPVDEDCIGNKGKTVNPETDHNRRKDLK